ncbi:hypothetical protein K474DRAFT_956568 [Panus rudis PR-1116 ss-1]|nr:hypothetical protein K474DRAFT_956568 [Panus rudis PR-1116 ss-1]
MSIFIFGIFVLLSSFILFTQIPLAPSALHRLFPNSNRITLSTIVLFYLSLCASQLVYYQLSIFCTVYFWHSCMYSIVQTFAAFAAFNLSEVN